MCHCHAKVDFLSSSAFPQGNGLFCLYIHINFNVVSTALLLSHSMLSQQLLSRYTWCQLHLWVWSVASSHRLSVGPGCKCEALHCSARTCVPTQLFHDKHGFLGFYLKTLNPKLKCDSLSITCFRVLLTFTVTPCGRTSAAPVVKANVIAKALTWNKQDHWAISSLSRQTVTK